MGALDFLSAGIGATAQHISDGINYFNNKNTNATNRYNTESTNLASMAIANANNQMQIELNDRNNQFSHDEAELAYKRQLAMMREQNEWNSPLAMIQRYRNAGLNPSVAMAGSLGTSNSANPSVPQATPHGSGITPSMPNLSPFQAQPYFLKALGVSESAMQMAQAFSALADARKKGVETDQLKQIFEKHLVSLELQNVLQEENVRLVKAFGSEERAASVIEKYAHAFQLYQAGDELGARKILDETESDVNRALSRYHGAKADEARELANHAKDRVEAEIRNLNSSSTKNYAEAKTEDTLREGRKNVLQADARAQNASAAAQEFINDVNDYVGKAEAGLAQLHDFNKKDYESRLAELDFEQQKEVQQYLIEQAKIAVEKHNLGSWYFYEDCIKSFFGAAGQAALLIATRGKARK